MITSLLCLFLAVGCGPDAKQSMAPDLIVFAGDAPVHADRIELPVSIINWGAVPSSTTQLHVYINERPIWNDSTTRTLLDAEVPPLDPKTSIRFEVEIALDELEPDSHYYLLLIADALEDERNGRNRDYSGFSVDEEGKLIMGCDPSAPHDGRDGATDPLFDEQWHLENTGQRAYAAIRASVGEDLRMTNVLSSGTPTGAGVRIAVVDTGMELCHPDLAANVETDASYNFNANDWHNAEPAEPYLPWATGDHGTSVAGIAAAAAYNGTGGRGVAPGAVLRSYNMLAAVESEGAYYDSLGGSETDPDSTLVDIFNMSFGTLPGEFGVDPNEDQLLRHGVTNLRNGRGALYVKSAGNAFNGCGSIRRPANARIGCSSSNSASSHHSPYLIMVGAFDAQGTRASYSSAGSNLWISAPAGEFGYNFGAIITTDQVGSDRGYHVIANYGVPPDDVDNPHGNYVSTFTGTSAAAPNASGAIALMLEAQPDLTWRDVKYILAKTARQIDADIESVQYLVGGTVYTAQLPWIANAAGYRFHNWYGFGAVAVDAALELVAGHTPDALGAFVEMETAPMADVVSIPDNDGAGIAQTLTVEGAADDANIEAVTLHVDITHPQTNDLAIHLTSPSGTESILNPIFNDALAGNADLAWDLLSNAFYGESPNGDWTMQVVDAAPEDEGTLNEWSLTFALGTHPGS
ncbi:MAG: S8 family serine peptidase [Gammaproteobacteria bacterium]|nr:S8 family serine peptidase [Gammaproteobacteria bacterium]MYF28726.1 S8 family serine peptidase [Gammaproteobacteria bacterium]MYK47672.1 S8 family serine peptidase [Gammaproteobacteria bacterium]